MKYKWLILLAIALIGISQTNIPSGGMDIFNSAGSIVISFFDSGDADFTGDVTANAFYGDGSNLTGLIGTGDVLGPASSDNNALARFDGTTGKVIKNSTTSLADDGTLTATAFIGDGSGLTGVSGAGDVNGAASSTDNSIARYDGVTGKVIQNSNVQIDDSDNIVTSALIDGRDVSVDGTKLDTIETGATADQTNSEIETAYNAQVSVATQAEMEAGVSTTVKRMSPNSIALAIAALSVGDGDVNGAASSTDNSIVRYDGITGKVIQNSNVQIDDSDNIVTSALVDGRDVSVDGIKLDTIETGATADQTDAEIETAYNNRVPMVSFADATAGTSSIRYGWSPVRIKEAVQYLAPAAQTDFSDSSFSLFQLGDVSATGYFSLSNVLTGTNIGITWPSSNLDLGNISDSFVSNTLTSSKFIGSGSTTDAVDLDSSETDGKLPYSKLPSLATRSLLGRKYNTGTGDTVPLSMGDTMRFLDEPITIGVTLGLIGWNHTSSRWFEHTMEEPSTISNSDATPEHNQISCFIIHQHATTAKSLSWGSQFIAGADYSDTIPALTTELSGTNIYIWQYRANSVNKFILRYYGTD